MLVLSRRIGETIVIDQNISVHVLQVSGGSVRLGIEAPSHIRILRGELELSKSDEALEIMVPKTAADSQLNCPNSSPGITRSQAIDPQQLLRPTDLLQ